MRALTMWNLVDLLESETPNPEGVLQKTFEWHAQREIEQAKLLIAAGTSLLVALFVGVVKGELHSNELTTISGFCGCMLVGAYGLAKLWRTRLVSLHFISALGLLKRLKPLLPYLKELPREVA